MNEPPFEILVRERKRKGLTQAELCAGVMSQSMLCQVENGRVVPSKRTLMRLCERLDIDGNNLWHAWTKFVEGENLDHRLWEQACCKDADGLLLLLNDAHVGCEYRVSTHAFYRAFALALQGNLDAAEVHLAMAWQRERVSAKALVIDAWAREEIYTRCERQTAATVWADKAKVRLSHLTSSGDSLILVQRC